MMQPFVFFNAMSVLRLGGLMPHLILEHNYEDADLVKYVCKKIHGCLAKQETVKLESIKTRSLFVASVICGNGLEVKNLAHLHLKLLPGRSQELKLKMSQELLKVLNETLKEGSFSVEVSELASYSK